MFENPPMTEREKDYFVFLQTKPKTTKKNKIFKDILDLKLELPIDYYCPEVSIQDDNINFMDYYIRCFNDIPCYHSIRNINYIKVLQNFFYEFKDDIISYQIFEYDKTERFYSITFLLKNCILSFYCSDSDKRNHRIQFYHKNFEKLDLLKEKIYFFNKKIFKREIYIIHKNQKGYYLKSSPLNKYKLNINDNYNNDFKQINDIIIKRLKIKDNKGIILLHGKPGTGKTSYIRYLTSVINKDVIFIPTNLVQHFTDPEFFQLLIENQNSVLVIEDAEKVVIDRNNDFNSAMSPLLNISDGLLSDFLNIQVICSFNTDISKIDSALLRKGRLIAQYEFKELETDKAQELSNKLGFKTIIDKPQVLTDIFNQEEQSFVKPEKKIGF